MELDRSTMKKLLLLIAFAAALLMAALRLERVTEGLRFILDVLTPFLAGAAIAFVLNVPMRALERRLFPPWAGRGAAASPVPSVCC